MTRSSDIRGGLRRAIVVGCAMIVLSLIAARGAQAGDGQRFCLVATRDMPDPLFQQSVILMLPQTEPALVAGIIINRPTTIAMRKLFPDAAPKNQAVAAYFGGPVDFNDPAMVVRAAKPSGATTRLFDGMYLIDDPDAVAKLMREPRPAADFRVFLGRAQWTPDQLHAEIIEGSWYIVAAKPAQVFSADGEALWRELVRDAQLQEVDFNSGGPKNLVGSIWVRRRSQ